MFNRTTWRADWQRDPWLLPLSLLCLGCCAPFLAQLFGWWHPNDVQRDATSVLCSGAPLVLLGVSGLLGWQRWPVSRRPRDLFALAILGLSVASGLIAIVTGVGVLLGVSTALPIAPYVLSFILFVIIFIGAFARP